MKLSLAGAVVGVVLAMAMLGTGSASAATQLCKINTSPSPCTGSNIYPASTTFTVNGEFGISPITGCEFTYKFVTGASSGSPLPAEITSFTFAHCGSGYTVTPVLLNWGYQIAVSGTGPNGVGKMVPGSKGFLGFEVNGNGELGCQYTTKTSFPQTIGGGSTTTASMVALANSAGSGCVTGGVSISMGGFSTPKFFVTG